MAKNKEKVLIIIICILLLIIGTLIGYIISTKTSNPNNTNNNIIENNKDNQQQLLSEDEALTISKEVTKKYFEFKHYLGAFCGDVNSQDYISFGSYETKDFRDYWASTSYKNINELKTYLNSIMSEKLLPNYLNNNVSYIEQNGKLYCQLAHKGPGETYNENLSTFNVLNINRDTINLKVTLVSDVVNSHNTRTGNITIKKSNDIWVIDEYNVQINAH